MDVTLLIEDFRNYVSFVLPMHKILHQWEISCYTSGTLFFGSLIVVVFVVVVVVFRLKPIYPNTIKRTDPFLF